MGKGFSRLRLAVLSGLLVLPIVALVLIRHQLFTSTDITQLYRYADIILILISACSVTVISFYLVTVFKDKKYQGAAGAADLRKMKTKAQTDSLTGLNNREGAIEQISAFLAQDGRLGRHTMMMIDLDNFKSINDNFGHFEGDNVLKTLSAKIKAVFRTDDIVGRIGGDEFIVLMKNTINTGSVLKKTDELQSVLEYMVYGDEMSVTVTGSIGISTYSGGGKDFDTLFKEADEALYRAKLGGKNRYCHFDHQEIHGREEAVAGNVLRESGASIQLKALIDNIDGGIALLELADKIRSIYLSGSFVNQMKLSYDGIKKADNRIFSLIFPDDVQHVEQTLRDGAANDKPVEVVFRKQASDGRICWYHMRAGLISFENSVNPVMIGIFTDVTNLKETEINYAAQKKQLETVLKLNHVVTFEVDIASRTLNLTDSSLEKYGIKTHSIENMPEELIKIGAIHPDSVEECRRMYDEIYSGVEQGSAIIRTLKVNGQFIIERFTYFTVLDEKGHPVKAVGVAESMEASKNMILRVELLEKQFRYYANNMAWTIKVLQAQDSFVLLKTDATFESIFKNYHTYSDFLEHLLHQATEPGAVLQMKEMFSLEGLKKYYEQGQRFLNLEYIIDEPDGKKQWWSVTASIIMNHLNNEICAFVRARDITRVKTMGSELGVQIKRIPMHLHYSIETLRTVTDALIRRMDRQNPCAIVVLAMVNYKEMRTQYGQQLMNELSYSFVGKTMMMFDTEHLMNTDGTCSITVLIPDMQSEAWLLGRIEKTVKFFKNPANFEFYEEDFLQYQCGIAVSDNETGGFDDLNAKAYQALSSIEGQADKTVKFYNTAEITRDCSLVNTSNEQQEPPLENQ